MDLTLLIALAGATALLAAIPGPNVALIVGNTLERGTALGAVTVLGTTLGIGLQLCIVVLGLAALLEYATHAFSVLKWIGVAYLIAVGIRSWRRGAAPAQEPAATTRARRVVFGQGVLLALINPKTLIFNAAFLPQFVPTAGGTEALAQAAAVYVAVMFLCDMLWVTTAGVSRPALMRLGRIRHRLTGGLFIGSGIGLALSRIDR